MKAAAAAAAAKVEALPRPPSLRLRMITENNFMSRSVMIQVWKIHHHHGSPVFTCIIHNF